MENRYVVINGIQIPVQSFHTGSSIALIGDSLFFWEMTISREALWHISDVLQYAKHEHKEIALSFHNDTLEFILCFTAYASHIGELDKRTDTYTISFASLHNWTTYIP